MRLLKGGGEIVVTVSAAIILYHTETFSWWHYSQMVGMLAYIGGVLWSWTRS